MKKASDSTKKFFDEIVEDYKRNNGKLSDDGNFPAFYTPAFVFKI